jgi:hypothetical protein
MTVTADWPYVPRQAEVQELSDVTRENYDAFVLCTPTSIMSGNLPRFFRSEIVTIVRSRVRTPCRPRA